MAKRFSLTVLRDAAHAEARRIEAVQGALVASGDRLSPCSDQLDRARQFADLGDLVERVRLDPVILDRLKKGSS